MSLDCNTKIGREWIQKQHSAVNSVATMFGAEFIETPDYQDCPYDVLYFRDRILSSIAEVKARDMTLKQLQSFRSYLVTFEKLLQGRNAAVCLRVPYYLIVKLTDAICYWKVCNSDGEWTVAFRVTKSKTQQSCNGGESNRVNTYIELDTMKIIV